MDKDNEKEKELSELIKDTLAGYEEEYVAGAWENFARKQKYSLKKEENRRRRVVYMRYAAGLAASLLLGIILLNIYEKEQSTGTDTPLIAVIANGNKADSDQMPMADPDQISKNDAQQANFQQTTARQTTAKQIAPQKTSIQQTNVQQTPSKQITPQQTSTQQTTAQEAIAANTPANIPINKAPNNAPPTTPQQAIAANTPGYDADNIDKTQQVERSARKVRFGINVAQGINSTTTSTAYNYSGGVTVDIPLSKTLALSTGMQLENQSVVSKSTVSNTAIPSDNRRASLINLDIPLNIKWKFLSRKSGSYYIAGGISSLAYLSEKYTTTSRTQELREVVSFMGSEATRTYKLENVETTTTNTAGASNQFDIAGRLNISIGFEKQISPSLYLHIEPFMKIPVSGLAAENLIFTTSGITFKISF